MAVALALGAVFWRTFLPLFHGSRLTRSRSIQRRTPNEGCSQCADAAMPLLLLAFYCAVQLVTATASNAKSG